MTFVEEGVSVVDDQPVPESSLQTIRYPIAESVIIDPKYILICTQFRKVVRGEVLIQTIETKRNIGFLERG